MLPGCGLSVLVSEFLSGLDLTGSSWEKEYWEEYLARLELGRRLASVDVVLMSCGELRFRTPEKGYVSSIHVNPMQGRSPSREPSDPEYYPGDENIHGGKPQFQVHLLEVPQGAADAVLNTTALAMFLPREPQFDLKIVVRGELEENAPA